MVHPTPFIYLFIFTIIYMQTFSLQSKKPVQNISAFQVKQD